MIRVERATVPVEHEQDGRVTNSGRSDPDGEAIPGSRGSRGMAESPGFAFWIDGFSFAQVGAPCMASLVKDLVEAGVHFAHVDTPGGYMEIDTQQDLDLAQEQWT